jgi:hypothetical protein
MIDKMEDLLIGLVAVLVWICAIPFAIISLIIQNGNAIANNWLIRIYNFINKNKEE